MVKKCIICENVFDALRSNILTCSKVCSKINKKNKQKDYWLDNKDKLKDKRKEDIKKFHEENPDYKNEYMRKYRKTEKNKEYNSKRSKTEKYKETRNKRQRERYKEDLHYKLYTRIRSSLIKNLKRGSKKSKSLEYLGCDVESWKEHLEKLFDDNMNWDNYGDYWDIDHIKPLSSFDLSNQDEIKEAFNYKNTQPLESFYNRHIKKDNIEW